jgi:hypothetical protein
MHLD